jgi:hypothetical protein
MIGAAGEQRYSTLPADAELTHIIITFVIASKQSGGTAVASGGHS